MQLLLAGLLVALTLRPESQHVSLQQVHSRRAAPVLRRTHSYAAQHRRACIYKSSAPPHHKTKRSPPPRLAPYARSQYSQWRVYAAPTTPSTATRTHQEAARSSAGQDGLSLPAIIHVFRATYTLLCDPTSEPPIRSQGLGNDTSTLRPRKSKGCSVRKQPRDRGLAANHRRG